MLKISVEIQFYMMLAACYTYVCGLSIKPAIVELILERIWH